MQTSDRVSGCPASGPTEHIGIIHKGIMAQPLLLASQSSIRQALLARAGLAFEALPARIDEEALRQALEAEGASPRDMADALAEMKARKIAERRPESVVIGCDQVLEFQGQAWAKPADRVMAEVQLRQLRGGTHKLHSAVVLYHEAQPVWRHLETVRMTMRPFSDAYLQAYLSRAWPGVADSVGGYKIEEEGLRLFSRIEGDHYAILGLPLLPLLTYLGGRGFIAA
jgi:septum formation protein